MPSKEETSLQEQNPLSQAQNSIEHFVNAVATAQTHPNGDTIQQAREAEERASHALSQAQVADHSESVQRAKELFEQEKSRLDELENGLR